MEQHSVRELDVITAAQYPEPQYTSCLIVNASDQIILQKRGEDFYTYPGMLSAFGGKIEAGETPLDAVRRELHEELGAEIPEDALQPLGAITEACSNHQECVHTFFWHDREGRITGCYEGEIRAFSTAEEALEQDKLMDDVRWMLARCLAKQLLT